MDINKTIEVFVFVLEHASGLISFDLKNNMNRIEIILKTDDVEVIFADENKMNASAFIERLKKAAPYIEDMVGGMSNSLLVN